MEQLNDDQVTIILGRIITDGVTDNDLKNGLLDHYCCFIEERLKTGLDFESAYAAAFQNITPNGMQEIQEELYFILNFNKQTIMKRTIYLFGFITVFFLSTGIMFQAMHWTGWPVVYVLSLFLVIATAIILFSNSLKHWKFHSRAYNARVVTGFISALLIADGTLFRFFHLLSANIQIVLGVVLFNLAFLPGFIYHLYKQAVENTSKPISRL